MKRLNGVAVHIGFCGRTVDGQARQSVGVAMVTCLPVDNVILVSGEKVSIPLQASGCHGRQIFDGAEDRRQRLMICDEREASTVQICMKLFEAPHNTKGFLVNLAVILLCGVQRARSKGDGPALFRQAWNEKEQRPGCRARHHLPHEAVDPGGNASTPSQIRFDVSLRRKQQCRHLSSAKRCCIAAIG